MNLISVILVALKRLWNNKGLTLCSIVGLTTAVALISSVPLYTDAANFQVLKQRLSRAEGDGGRPRPAFAFMYRYIGAWHGAIEMDDYAPVNEYLTRSVPGLIGLPLETSTRHVKTDNFSLFPAADASYIGIRQPLGWVSLGFIQDVEQHIHVVDGEFPTLDMESDVISVLVSQAFSNETGVQVGEDYVVFRRDDSGDQVRQVQITLRIGGIWEPIDASHPFWFYNPDTMNSVFLVPEETFRLRLAPQMCGEIYAAIWYMVFDGDHVRTDDVPGLLGRVRYANTRVSALLPNTTLDVSPVDALENYRWTTFVMTIVLYVFAAPILGLVLYFIGMISGMVVERQRGEIAILKSRGAGDLQMVGIYALEGTLIGLIGLGFGLLAGRYLAGVMGNTISFLTFGERQPLHVLVTPRAVRFALVGVAVGMLASLWPAMRAARLTIVTYKHERARDMERPLWQRYFLDLLLLIPAGYGYYVLSNRGTIAILGGGNGDPFQDPLLFLVPSVTILAISLLFIRFFPLLMEFLAWATGQTVQAVAVVLALRQLARVSRQYTGALLLLVLTLSLATFTASMARTLDESLIHRMYYRTGSDYMLV
ncbi:MAG TPA: FtsX-like permease family protein, partial [Chloroflexi bacterium]|nr:FtsX-like permease family protein [Chloroflexota bacterium]